MKIPVISSCESHRYSCCHRGYCFPLPTFMIEGKAKFHLGVGKDENVFFPIQVHGTPDSTHGSIRGPGTPMKSWYSTNTGSCLSLSSHLYHRPFCLPCCGHTTLWLFKHIQLSPPGHLLSLFYLGCSALRALRGVSFLLSLCELKYHLLQERCPDQPHLRTPLPWPPYFPNGSYHYLKRLCSSKCSWVYSPFPSLSELHGSRDLISMFRAISPAPRMVFGTK